MFISLFPSVHHLSTSRVLLAGGTAGMLNWLIALPADVLKSNYQTGTQCYRTSKKYSIERCSRRTLFSIYTGMSY